MSDYTMGAIAYVLVAAVLILALLIGGILVVNLGMMSKRPEDRVGGRTPSDVGILQNSVWPESPYKNMSLPAEEEADEISYQTRSKVGSEVLTDDPKLFEQPEGHYSRGTGTEQILENDVQVDDHSSRDRKKKPSRRVA